MHYATDSAIISKQANDKDTAGKWTMKTTQRWRGLCDKTPSNKLTAIWYTRWQVFSLNRRRLGTTLPVGSRACVQFIFAIYSRVFALNLVGGASFICFKAKTNSIRIFFWFPNEYSSILFNTKCTKMTMFSYKMTVILCYWWHYCHYLLYMNHSITSDNYPKFGKSCIVYATKNERIIGYLF